MFHRFIKKLRKSDKKPAAKKPYIFWQPENSFSSQNEEHRPFNPQIISTPQPPSEIWEIVERMANRFERTFAVPTFMEGGIVDRPTPIYSCPPSPEPVVSSEQIMRENYLERRSQLIEQMSRHTSFVHDLARDLIETGKSSPLDKEYPHKCQICKRNLFFKELCHANRSLPESYLKKLWELQSVEFLCCGCFGKAQQYLSKLISKKIEATHENSLNCYLIEIIFKPFKSFLNKKEITERDYELFLTQYNVNKEFCAISQFKRLSDDFKARWCTLHNTERYVELAPTMLRRYEFIYDKLINIWRAGFFDLG